MPRTVEHETGLLVRCLGRYKPHARPLHRLADGLSIAGVVLLALYVRLHVGRWHQSNRVPESLQLARPVVRRGTRLDANHARQQLLKEAENPCTPELLANDNLAIRIDTVNLENGLRNVETDRRDRLHIYLLRILVTYWRPILWRLRAGWRSRPQHHFRTSGAKVVVRSYGRPLLVPHYDYLGNETSVLANTSHQGRFQF